MDSHQSALLGQLLLNYGMISDEALAEALRAQETRGEPLGQILVSMGALDPRSLELVLRAQARLRGRPGASQPHILVIDDDPEVGALLGDILCGAGYSAGVAQNASEALAALAKGEREPALIVLDLGLPGMGGLDLLAQLRDTGCRIPVVVLTGNPAIAAEARTQHLGVSEVLGKPTSARTLLNSVEAALRGQIPAGV
jgi:CheY-like chemotaxis protein